MYYVYILECSDSSLYTGITNNLEKRLKKHNTGKGAKYTRSRLPVRMMYFEYAKDRSCALKREIEIKKMNREEKIELINKIIWY